MTNGTGIAMNWPQAAPGTFESSFQGAPWFPFTVTIPPDITITLHADGQWSGDGEAFRTALAEGKGNMDGQLRILLWLMVREMERA